VPSPLPDGTLPGLGLCVSTGPGQAGALAAWMTATESAALADTLLGPLAARLHAQDDAAPDAAKWEVGGAPLAARCGRGLSCWLSAGGRQALRSGPLVVNPLSWRADGAECAATGCRSLGTWKGGERVLYEGLFERAVGRGGLLRLSGTQVHGGLGPERSVSALRAATPSPPMQEAYLKHYRRSALHPADYHAMDVHLFWGPLRRNAEAQLRQWQQRQGPAAAAAAAEPATNQLRGAGAPVGSARAYRLHGNTATESFHSGARYRLPIAWPGGAAR
jgi:hypothetical protein